ncbi:restriction endonuclease [Metabacillus sp. GX 13764]|uniref:restriction endonuclease n=1 Tax=Metabacillus kandeliae TaxID=2900151 RepID=UPI001E44C788|nr:restriction endonuclease [Metabacillus kandeliae]MCD7034487.1 restriction endonuclease [Metabacillus kandeliae]
MPKSTKKQQKAQQELISLLTVGAAAGAYWMTKSFIAAGIILFLLLGILMAVILLLKADREKKLRQSGIQEIDNMDGIQFENYLAALFKQLGYSAKVTPSGGDYGADLILQGEKGRIAVQAKRYKSKVGIKAVQEIASAKAYYSANEAWVVTNSEFTAQARNLALSAHVRLIGRDELIQLILKTKKAS